MWSVRFCVLVEVFVSLCGCLSEVVPARLFARSLCVSYKAGSHGTDNKYDTRDEASKLSRQHQQERVRYLAQPTPPHPGRASASAAPRAPAAVRSQGGNTAVVAVGDVTGNGGGRVVEQPGVREDDGTGDAAEVVSRETGLCL